MRIVLFYHQRITPDPEDDQPDDTPDDADTPPQEKAQTLTFKTQEEMDAYYDEKYNKRIDELEKKIQEKNTPPEPDDPPEPPKKYVDGQPKAWDDLEF